MPPSITLPATDPPPAAADDGGPTPGTAIVDLRGSRPAVVYLHRGASPRDRPTIDDLLSRLAAAARPADA